ncbi:substrate-binding periplasmic protein [Deinococcus aestuarii]|uniref:substrate-binding periplasmic protein n=1 Tax=Deinococcus aestuarii TaxID=2774531 RepID=UPI001C0CEAA5|nr:transporter substrate-binding domain-containing protein [Deinococcus aestuarii]
MTVRRGPVGPPPRPRRWRPSGSTVFIIVGVLAYLGLRQLPPDNSLALVRQAGVMSVCIPAELPPFVTATEDGARGQEAELLRRAAARIGTSLEWNLQASWGTTPDPVDWGLRPESCQVLAGGIVVSPETQALMQPLPYAETGWALLTFDPAKSLGVLANHWGLNAEEAYDWADRQGQDFTSYDHAGEALAALKGGEVGRVLSLREEAEWLQGQLPGARVQEVSDLPRHTLALGMWKNSITLKRALTAALPQNPGEAVRR